MKTKFARMIFRKKEETKRRKNASVGERNRANNRADATSADAPRVYRCVACPRCIPTSPVLILKAEPRLNSKGKQTKPLAPPKGFTFLLERRQDELSAYVNRDARARVLENFHRKYSPTSRRTDVFPAESIPIRRARFGSSGRYNRKYYLAN